MTAENNKKKKPSGHHKNGRNAGSSRKISKKELERRRKELEREKKRKRRRRNKIIIIIIEIIIILVLLAGLYVWQKMNLMNRTKINDKEVGISEEIDTEVVKGYKNIAVFGLDNRSNGNLDSGNSDVIMVISIDNDSGEIRLLSVYRDTYLAQGSASNYTYRKANAAFAEGGATEAIKMLNTNLDLDITDYATVDFLAVTDAVDLVGGVEIDVQEDEVDLVNGYTDSVAEVTGKSDEHISGPGLQTLNGVQATAYCRIRYTAGGDFTRAQRQRTVLSQLFKKAKQSDLATINTMIDKILPDIETSLSDQEIVSLAANVMKYKLADTAGFPFTLTTDTLGAKGAVDIPCTLESNVRQLYKWMFHEDDYEPSSTVKEISDHIINETGYQESDAVDYGIAPDNLSEDGTSSDTSTDGNGSDSGSDTSDTSGTDDTTGTTGTGQRSQSSGTL